MKVIVDFRVFVDRPIMTSENNFQ